ncbi:hypothetical protein NIES2109_12620 [Nostoc sp. HK-01]|nr:hypothetical protein NIES2109_12620 [Nostoc sp. HK-01]
MAFELFVNDLEQSLKIIWDKYRANPTLGNWINSANPNFSYIVEEKAKQLSNTYGTNGDWVSVWMDQVRLVARNQEGTERPGTYYEVMEVVSAWKYYLPES